ncbi:SubName: Full=Uncharacterized protein {ECO:0000313/EMBL:CCA71323.1} [Serendipita indica DSM 11827]|uniref:SH3 domain-containing protein n=1 Tax=Serendipita indica (strain DSM 11827) TaxID=1109443 RepID=G4TJ21_SERID|nr:SubName: Full=Uncharacterized protein {ECO:0000313/EMBL:CCA71323.1} [Serendipita indica DSM 11827]CCA71323.1 hypothetical protein PIIN_05262 [Serendipita indica DSM 11827]
MIVAPGHLEARDAIRHIEARQGRGPPTPVAPADPPEDDGDIISMILSGIFGGIDDEPTTTSTRSSTRSTSTRSTSTTTSSTRSTSTSTSTRTTAEVVTTPPPVVATPTPSSSSARSTTIITQTANNANNTANDTSKNNSGLPSVVIGVIVAAAVIFGLIFIALIARKIFQAKRRRRRATWAENGGVSPFQDPLVREKALPPPPPPETQDYTGYPAYPPAAVTFANQPAPYSPAAASSAGYPAPYPFGGTGNVAQPNGVIGTTTTASMFQSSSAYSPADLAGPVVIQQTPPTPIAGSTTVPAASAQLSVVKRTFIPSLPDELSIANGEQVRVLSLYDDGWALCEKVATGEKGVVPQECLESAQSAVSNTPAQQLAGSEESARLNRNSSLRRGQEQTY